MQEGQAPLENQGTQATQTYNEPSQPVQAPATEKLLPQEKVNQLVGEAKQRGYEKGRAEFESQRQSVPQVGNQPQNPQMDENYLRDFMAKELAKRDDETRQQELMRQQESEGRRILTELAGHRDAAEAKYPDFKEATQWMNLNDRKLSDVLVAINGVENAPDLIYDLAKNPDKAALYNNAPDSAKPMLIRKWSESVKVNQQASGQRLPNAPLKQITPSNVGLDNGKQALTPESARKAAQGWF